MTGLTWIHITGGLLALATGTAAFALRKGSRMHARAGIGFCVAMFVLGVTASILAPLKTPPGSPVGGIMVCYFVGTAWMAAHRRSGTPGWLEKMACAVVMLIALAILGEGIRLSLLPAPPTTPPAPAVLILLGALCLLAGVADLKYIRRGSLTPTQRISRHLWRMCFAFFIATGSFFLGQQDVLPKVLQGSPILFVLAFAPFALMVYWLVRVRSARMIARLPPQPTPGAGNANGFIRPGPAD